MNKGEKGLGRYLINCIRFVLKAYEWVKPFMCYIFSTKNGVFDKIL